MARRAGLAVVLGIPALKMRFPAEGSAANEARGARRRCVE